MCRLAFASADFLRCYTEDEFTDMFAALEIEMGGHGMGVAYRLPRRNIQYYKGLDATAEQCAAFWYRGLELGAKEFLFHTRLASVGGKSDDLCHPFVDRKSALAHNGHDSNYVLPGWPTSDSALIAQSLWRGYLDVTKLHTLSGTFIGWMDGIPFVQAKAGYDCEASFISDKAWLFASTIPLSMQAEFYRASGYEWFGQTTPPRPSKLIENKWGKLTQRYSDLDWQQWDEDDDDIEYAGDALYPRHTYISEGIEYSYYIDGDGHYHERMEVVKPRGKVQLQAQ